MNTSVLHNLCLVESSNAEQWMWKNHGGWQEVADCKSHVDFQLFGGSVLLTPELTVQGSNVLISGKIRLYSKGCTLYIHIYISHSSTPQKEIIRSNKFLR